MTALQLTRLVQKKGNGDSRYDTFLHACLWLIVFLTPFFFLPFTTDPLELNKSMLLYALVLVAGVVWLLKLVVRREGSFQRSPVDLPIALFVVFSLLAATFSLYLYRSVAGISGYVSGSLVSTIAFVAFFYLIINIVRREHLLRYLHALLLSSAVIVLFNFLQVFGFFLFPWDFSRVVSFNAAVNSPATFSIFLALTILLSLFRVFWFQFRHDRRPLERGLLLLLVVVSFFLLMVYDQQLGWYALILGMLLFLVFLTSSTRHYPSVMLVVPTVLIGLALVGVFVNTQSLLRANLPGDVQLPLSHGMRITAAALKASPLVGFGQETYNAVFARFRPAAFNDTSLWQLHFLKSSNEWFQQAATIGVLGTLSLFAVLFLAMRAIIRGIRAVSPDDERWWALFPFFTGAALLTLATFVLPFNFLLWLLLWLFLGLGVVAVREKGAPVSPKSVRAPGAGFGASLGFSLAVILGIVFCYFAGRFWIADTKVIQANRAVAAKEDLDRVRALFSQSIDLNPYENSAYFDLAQNLLVQAQIGSQKKDADLNQLRVLITASVTAGRAGADHFKKYSGSYEALSQLYQSIDTLTGTTSDETKKAFTAAIDLEPENPQLYMNLGQFYLSVARLKSNLATQKDEKNPDAQLTKDAADALENAKNAFTEAGRRKTNFIDASLNVALVLRLQGKGADAVTMLEDLAAKNPFNVDALFNLSENYLVDKRPKDAEPILRRIISIFPGHSDAHFRLAQIYEDRGEKENAIAELEEVKKINPDSTDVQKKLDELKAK